MSSLKIYIFDSDSVEIISKWSFKIDIDWWNWHIYWCTSNNSVWNCFKVGFCPFWFWTHPSCSHPFASSLVTGDCKCKQSNQTNPMFFFLSFDFSTVLSCSPCLCSFSHSSSDEEDSEEEDQSQAEILQVFKKKSGLVRIGPSSSNCFLFFINISNHLPTVNCSQRICPF